jgi:ribosomal protein L37AE/L43A
MTDVRTSELTCSDCDHTFTVTHAHGDIIECPKCEGEVETAPATPEPDKK